MFNFSNFKNIKYKTFNSFYLHKLCNQLLYSGIKLKLFKLFYYFYKIKILGNFFKCNNNYAVFNKNIKIDIKNNFITCNLNTIIMSFTQLNTFILYFFVNKQKTFINHKQKFLDKIQYVLIRKTNKNNFFFKILKIMYFKKNFKNNIQLLFFNNFLQNSNESTFFLIFQNLTFKLLLILF